MPDRSLWNWTLIIGAILAIVGVVAARLLAMWLPADAIPVVAGVFFSACVVVIGVLVAVFFLRRT